MFQFPDVGGRLAAIERSFADRFSFADDLCRAWQEAPLDRWFDGTSPDIRALGTRLAVQGLRQFHSVVEECRRGEGFCGDIIGRSLFETVVAIGFLLKSSVTIELKPILDKETKTIHLQTDDGVWRYRAAVDNSGSTDHFLSREFRAQLYAAHDALSHLVFFERFAAVPGIADKLGREDLDNLKFIAAEAAEHEKIIGERWTYVLKEKETYSGLNLAETTGLVCPHLFQVYRVAYKGQCSKAHAADALNIHDWFSTNEEIHGTLRVASMLILRAIDMIQKFLDVTSGDGIDLQPWSKRFNAVFDRTAEQSPPAGRPPLPTSAY